MEGHELANTITDPLFSAWYNSGGLEISDVCAGVNPADVNLSGHIFAMPPLWSKAAGRCVL